MSKKHLYKLLTYINKVYDLSEKIKGLKDKRPKPKVATSTVSFLVLMGFMLQMRSFNRLNKWTKKDKFKRLFKRGTKLPSIDTIRYSLSEFDLDTLNNMYDNVIKTIKKNKVFIKGTIDDFRVAAIDGVELFESTEKHCNECLTRKDKNGKIHYFHKSIVCMMIGIKPNIIIGQEMLNRKKDSSEKDEGELTGSKRLIKKLHDKYKHFADVIVADALYMNAPWINEILDLGMDAVIRVKDENLFNSTRCDRFI
ncbi:hypothetical protein [Clostridium senegalense]|uniref:hypothetical protein n=1 Tax=Clostridium senegalense TaxID=1465809 RepID=UPI00030C28A5|nr:hypothetical protein [Clostridium senegalense]